MDFERDEEAERAARKARKAAKRKSREEESSEVEVTEQPVVEDVPEENGDLKKKKKKDKKEKRAKGEVAEAVQEVVASDEVVDEAVSRAEAKRLKKAKKEAKRMLEVAAEVESSSVPVTARPSKSSASSSSLAGSNYVDHPAVSALTDDDILEFRREAGIAVYPVEDSLTWKPVTSFEYIYPSLDGHCPQVRTYIESKGFSKPSPIQSQCWHPLLSGKDVIGIASTGSGKTLAFLVPALLKIAKLGPLRSTDRVPKPRVLIVAPTRELALQSHDVVVGVGAAKGVCIYGGVPKPTQKAELRAGAEVVVATPGRLLDLVEEGALSLSEVRYMVLDEADRMLDDGFEPAIRQILSKCPAAGHGRQTVMFSATWPEEIRGLADTFLCPDVVRVAVGSEELSANHRVTQIVECVEAWDKNKKLFGLLEQYHKSRKNRILIFVLYKKEAVSLQSTIEARGYKVTAIHGDKGQYDRMAALEEFKSGTTPLLIATDVAARGLDIPQVEYVINYSFPLTVEDYVHRIGRTGRGGATGISHTFFAEADKGLAGALVAVLQEAQQEVPKEIYKYPMITKKKQSKLYGDFGPKTELAGKKATKITFD